MISSEKGLKLILRELNDMELRTLEDMENFCLRQCNRDEGAISIEELRQEAIKWIQYSESLDAVDLEEILKTDFGDDAWIIEKFIKEFHKKQLMKFLNIKEKDIKITKG